MKLKIFTLIFAVNQLFSIEQTAPKSLTASEELTQLHKLAQRNKHNVSLLRDQQIVAGTLADGLEGKMFGGPLHMTNLSLFVEHCQTIDPKVMALVIAGIEKDKKGIALLHLGPRPLDFLAGAKEILAGPGKDECLACQKLTAFVTQQEAVIRLHVKPKPQQQKKFEDADAAKMFLQQLELIKRSDTHS